MPREKKKKNDEGGGASYLTTWADMTTLLLCFFVMLLAMSTVNPAKFMVAASSFQNAFSGVLKSFPTVPIHEHVLRPRMGGDEQNKRMAINAKRRIERRATQQDMQDAVKVKVTEKGLAIRISDPVLFDVGDARLKPKFKKLLYSVGKIINEDTSTQIRVEGHTDNTPINTAKYPSNWDLSAERALNVVKFLARNAGIDPARLSAVGYGEYHPVVPNTSPENRQRNRRIEIYVNYTNKSPGKQLVIE